MVQPMKLFTTGLPVCARLVPKQLTELHKEECLDMCKWLLDHSGPEGDHFLERIVTEDATWIHHYEPDGKHKHMEWKHPHSPARKKFRTDPTAGKLNFQFLGLTRAATGTLSRESFGTVTSARDSEMLCDKLKPAF